MFLELLLLLLLLYGFCPGDHVSYAFVEGRADDGEFVPVAKGLLHYLPHSAHLQLPPCWSPQHLCPKYGS